MEKERKRAINMDLPGRLVSLLSSVSVANEIELPDFFYKLIFLFTYRRHPLKYLHLGHTQMHSFIEGLSQIRLFY